MTNEEAMEIARRVKDPQKAAKELTAEALRRESKDDISCVVVRFRWQTLWKDTYGEMGSLYNNFNQRFIRTKKLVFTGFDSDDSGSV